MKNYTETTLKVMGIKKVRRLLSKMNVKHDFFITLDEMIELVLSYQA